MEEFERNYNLISNKKELEADVFHKILTDSFISTPYNQNIKLIVKQILIKEKNKLVSELHQ
jgi:hypothetical protein